MVKESEQRTVAGVHFSEIQVFKTSPLTDNLNTDMEVRVTLVLFSKKRLKNPDENVVYILSWQLELRGLSPL